MAKEIVVPNGTDNVAADSDKLVRRLQQVPKLYENLKSIGLRIFIRPEDLILSDYGDSAKTLLENTATALAEVQKAAESNLADALSCTNTSPTTDITQLKSNAQTPSWHSCGKPSQGNGEHSVTRYQTISAS